VTLALALQTIVADRRRRTQSLFGIVGVESISRRRGVTPDAGETVGL